MSPRATTAGMVKVSGHGDVSNQQNSDHPCASGLFHHQFLKLEAGQYSKDAIHTTHRSGLGYAGSWGTKSGRGKQIIYPKSPWRA